MIVDMAVPFIRSSCFLASRDAKRSSLGILLALVMLGAWTLWFLRARVSVFAVTDLANLEVDRSAYPVQAPVEGRVISTNLSLEGQVKAGDVLVTLESNRERLQLSEERTKLSMLGPQIDAIEKTIVDAGTALHQG